jgi:hypothetical protein
VWRWKLSVDVSPASVELGQPLTVRVILDGMGNVTNVTLEAICRSAPGQDWPERRGIAT